MNSELLTIRNISKLGRALYALAPLPTGTTIHKGRGILVNTPGMHTLQLAEDKHLVVADKFRYLSHSCEPNCRILTYNNDFEVVTLRDISANSLLSFNYLTTEWEMQAPFHCSCGAPHCLKTIRGYKHASREVQILLWDHCSEALRRLAEKPALFMR
jgi:hypothetical protein